ncbi:hypothetical protein G7Z17_g4364 [Cylindrodendrum hubeiense]|uniref:NAD(P)-binding protein n=1 Tax=Cylindrodendrum hubeiense TaxID=595255 RepID=A0A9P5H903_9HYPO|nr:hypothetical protein G7Z17_g4364 [Cylindrodendrum hubeiense]
MAFSMGLFRPKMIQQAVFPGSPKFTEKDIPDLTNKVYVVTGSNTGVGFELTRILYSANATVYMACRTERKTLSAIEDIKTTVPGSKGRLEYLYLDLGDLRTIKPAAEVLISKEDRLDVLFNNAGVMMPPNDVKTAQGYDMELGTNCLGSFLFTQLLTPILAKTAQAEAAGAVRVVWVSSMAAELYSLKYGVDMNNIKGKDYAEHPEPMAKYGNSKAGNYLHSIEYARRHQQDGILSVAANPGNLDSDLYRTTQKQKIPLRVGFFVFQKLLLHPLVNGAYTELFAGLSKELFHGESLIESGRILLNPPPKEVSGLQENFGTGVRSK